ncbi:MAG: polyprenyl diphosphate synthase [Casimicrobiaceae bacterium]|nr:polyprenyl diphosphate synthase [Casimicrobiaceae bacterium]MCX8098956.1 polyprenyl diphosphate synthase [Casimicrobiaceae bacterium]MDW8312474.1 polyprenyl diphosphate synthase [Burkholderiales bacterium]
MTRFGPLPRHVAVVMDGNGRWAQRRLLPRVAGHQQGMEAARTAIRVAGEHGIQYLTLFAFSSENWRRPPEEVGFLMDLFLKTLREELDRLNRSGVRFRAIGDLSRLPAETQRLIAEAQAQTARNSRLWLNVAVNYGGRWDLEQAVAQAAARGEPEAFARYRVLAEQPDPDLLIRTGGEQRISNFLLWELAYTELYFTDVLWPDFSAEDMERALAWYATRERRFGMTSEQLREASHV